MKVVMIVYINERGLEKQRLAYLDVYKGIGIVLMIMGHISFGSIFSKFIHAFHMPLFFFASGYLYHLNANMEAGGVLKKRAKRLIIPYFAVGLFHYGIWFILYYDRANDVVLPLKNLLLVNTNPDMPIAGALWFLTCVFFVYLFFDLVFLKWRNDNAIMTVLVILVLLIGSFYPSIMSIRLPWAMDTAMVGIGIFYAGYLARTVQMKSDRNLIDYLSEVHWAILIVLLLILTGFIFLNDSINMREITYGIIPLFWFNAIGFCIVLLAICKKTESLFSSKFWMKAYNRIAYIGKNSIIFLCFNQLIILCCNKGISVLGVSADVTALIVIEKIIILAVTIGILLIITKAVTDSKLRYIFGK